MRSFFRNSFQPEGFLWEKRRLNPGWAAFLVARYFMSNDTTPPESQLSLSLLENGLDFIVKGLDELFGENHTLKNAKATDVEIRNYKYGITNLFSGFLLLLKERLSRHIPELIFAGKLSDVKQKLQTGKRVPITVDLDEALERLEIGPKVTFSQDEIEVIRKIQDFRNQFEHYKVTANKYQLWAEIAKFLDVIEKFLRNELGIEIEKYSKESKLLQKRGKALRDTVVKFDSAIEREVFEVLHNLSGREIPGQLVGSESNLLLPEIRPAQESYTIDTGIYYPDFEGTSNDSAKWIIEVKGAYMPTGGFPILNRLHAIQSQFPKVKIWLIVVGEIPAITKVFAARFQIYLTDIIAWQEIKNLSK